MQSTKKRPDIMSGHFLIYNQLKLYSLKWQIIVFPIIGRDIDRGGSSSLWGSAARLSGLYGLGSHFSHPPCNQRVEITGHAVLVCPRASTEIERHFHLIAHAQ